MSALLPALKTVEVEAVILRIRTRYFGPQLALVPKQKKPQSEYPRTIVPHTSLVPHYDWQPFGCHDNTFKVIVRDEVEHARMLAPR